MHNRWTSLRVIHSASQWWCTLQSWGCRSGPVQDFCWHRSSCRWLLKHPAWGFQINVEQVLLLCTRKYTAGKCCHSVRNIFMFVIILSSLILCLVGVILIGSLQLQVDQLYFLTSTLQIQWICWYTTMTLIIVFYLPRQYLSAVCRSNLCQHDRIKRVINLTF